MRREERRFERLRYEWLPVGLCCSNRPEWRGSLWGNVLWIRNTKQREQKLRTLAGGQCFSMLGHYSSGKGLITFLHVFDDL